MLLARALVRKPDIPLLLDEPPTISTSRRSRGWKASSSRSPAACCSSPTTGFLRALASRIVEIDRARHQLAGDYDNYLRRREALRRAQEQARFDELLAQEAWIRQGIRPGAPATGPGARA